MGTIRLQYYGHALEKGYGRLTSALLAIPQDRDSARTYEVPNIRELAKG